MNLNELYTGCRSYRKFRQEPIPADVYSSILHNVRITHCAANKQQLRFCIIQSEEARKKMHHLVHYASYLPREVATPKEDETPMGYIVITRPEPAGITDIDLGIAAQVICSTAWEAGVGSCMLLNFDHVEVNKLIEINEGRNSGMVIALGYPAHESKVVPVGPDKSIKYYVDENANYSVPKLDVKKLCWFI